MSSRKVSDKELHKIMEDLLDSILAPNTEDGIGTDNMTAILIKLYNK
jgi:serine/threonine protein phosphatase PrpC